MIPELATADDLSTELCTLDGSEHTYEPYRYTRHNGPHWSLRCTNCHVVACGDVGEVDPCIEPYHHPVPHRSMAGVRWPLGGDRKDRRA